MSSVMRKGNRIRIYVSKEKFDSCLNLLLITEGEVKHYCLIKDFNKFMHNQTKHNGKKAFLYVLSSMFKLKRAS